MNILLINPWIYDFAAYDLWAKPLGLLYIGSFLENNGYRIRLIDCMDRLHPSVKTIHKNQRFTTGKFYTQIIDKPKILKTIPRNYKRYGIPFNAFIKDLEAQKPTLIIITSHMTYWYPGVFETIRICKEIYPNVPIILGGIYASLCFEHAKENAGADYVLPGNNKNKLLNLVRSLCGQTPSFSNPTETFSDCLYPAYHLYSKLESISIATSLGCPLNCTYCASHFLQSEFIERSTESVFDEIVFSMEKYAISDIAFYDDALLIHSENRFIPLAERIAHRNFPITFHTPNGLHVRYINQQVAHSLYSIGVKTLRLSFEGVHPHIQQLSSTKTSNTELVDARNRLLKAGYKESDIEVYILVGLPGQKKEDMFQSINFVDNLGLTIKLACYSPIPHTQEFEKTTRDYPFIQTDPLYHNNTVFMYKVGPTKNWLEEITIYTKEKNQQIK